MKDVNRIFESIHDVYESHDGGGIWLSDNEKLLIKNQLRQLILVNKNESISNVSKCDFCGSIELMEGESHCKTCSIPDVVGQSEQLTCECVGLGSTECNKINDKWICCKCNRPLAG